MKSSENPRNDHTNKKHYFDMIKSIYSSTIHITKKRCFHQSAILTGKLNRGEKELLRVAIIGRPNVGKSTLFNRLTGRKAAIVSPVPGTTRDRKEGKAMLSGFPFEVVDTGGLDNRGSISVDIKKQIEYALQKSHVALLLLDSKVGITPIDSEYVKWLRKIYLNTFVNSIPEPSHVDANAPTITESEEYNRTFPKDICIVANKAEGGSFYNANSNVMDTLTDTYKWGLGEPIALSASHGDGISDLFSFLYDIAKKRGFETGDEDIALTNKHSLRKRKGKKELSKHNNNNQMTPALENEFSRLSLEEEGVVSSTLGNVDVEGKKNSRGGITTEERVIQLAIMGKPNVGKSTLLNAICNEERVIVGPTAGLTRDAVAVEWEYKDRSFKLVDTAGLTRITPHNQRLSADDKKKVSRIETMLKDTVVLPGIAKMDPEEDPSQFSCQVSEMSLVSALNALRFSQVVLLVVEGDQGKFSKIDLKLAEKCHKEGRALVVVANKSDVVEKTAGLSPTDYAKGVRAHCERYLKDFGHIPIVTTCAIKRHGVKKLLNVAISTHDAWSARISTWILNKWLSDLLVVNNTPRVSGKKIKIKYITQIKTRPPAFALFCNVDELPEFFERFLRFRLQTEFQLEGIFVRFVIRKTETRGENMKRKAKETSSNQQGLITKDDDLFDSYSARFEGDSMMVDDFQEMEDVFSVSDYAKSRYHMIHNDKEEQNQLGDNEGEHIPDDTSVVEASYTERYNMEQSDNQSPPPQWTEDASTVAPSPDNNDR